MSLPTLAELGRSYPIRVLQKGVRSLYFYRPPTNAPDRAKNSSELRLTIDAIRTLEFTEEARSDTRTDDDVRREISAGFAAHAERY